MCMYACMHIFFLCQTEDHRVGGGIGCYVAVCGFLDFVGSFHFMLHTLCVCVCVCGVGGEIQIHGMISLLTSEYDTIAVTAVDIW
jgi:hypothetical protein